MKRFINLLLLLPCLLSAQDEKKENVWQPLEPLVGTWEGTGHGSSGTSHITTEFTFILNKNYLRAKTKSVFEPQEANPDGETHEDIGFISYDRMRKTFVFRQFHIEGFVNRYVLDSALSDDTTFVFISESIENISPGWQARVTYRLVSDDELHISFDLAKPDEDFACLSENTLKRKLR
jgi:hypothetical protein